MNPGIYSYFPPHFKSTILYTSSVLFCTATIAVLPFLKTEVSVHAFGLIRPSSQVNTIRCISSGRIKKAHISENKRVKEGDLLYVIESESLDEQEKYYKEKIALKETFISDAQLAIKLESRPDSSRSTEMIPTFTTASYHQSYRTCQQKLIEAETRFNKAKQDYNRQQKLYKELVIAAAEFENYQFELQKAQDDIDQIRAANRTQWQSELTKLLEEKRDLESQLVRTQKEKATLTIKSPINGTVQNLPGIYTGSMVFANQELGQISPDTSLVITAFVQPNNIGLVQKKMKVRFQVDAFNYNQWGMVTGKVIDVPQDVKIINDKPVFEVRCSLDRDFLQLKSGYKGFLKKGMSVRARFIITERSLWQLLYDKMDDWMNPNL